MRKQARNILTGLLAFCCAFVGLVPTACVRADSSGSAGAFAASVFTSVRDFFVSGQALKMLETATQAINAFAVQLFLHLATLVVPILRRLVTGFSATPELVAIWMFWVVVVLALIILILALRPRHNVRKRLPRVSPRATGQGENTIEFGLVEQGPQPSPATSLDQLARTHEKPETPPVQELAVQPAVAEELSHARLEPSSVPEITLEPLGFFGGTDAASAAVPAVPADAAPTIAPDMPLPLEFTSFEAETPAAQTEQPEPGMAVPAAPADIPSEALLTPVQDTSSAEELPTETLLEPFPEPDLRPLGEEAPVQPVEPESSALDTVVPLDRPMPSEESSAAEGLLQAEEIPVSEEPVTPQAGSIEEPGSTEEMSTPVLEGGSASEETLPAAPETSEVATLPEAVPVETVRAEAVAVEAVAVEAVAVEAVPVEAVPVEAVPVEAVPVEIEPVKPDRESPAEQQPESSQPTPSSANLLSRLLADEESFQQTMAVAGATAGPAVPVPAFAPLPVSRRPAPPSIFVGDVELDALLQDGVVADADALAQLFRGGYRNRISKLAVSAKDLQNVPEEMRQVIKLTVVALSPIELSIARDLAMRLEAPGFVGEALLVTKKMGYQNYLTTYKNISKNYKDVSIVETVSLKAPDISAEHGEDLISFS
jgi:hypothetical protein